MYTVSKGPSKIVAKTRRGLSQNLDRLESRKDNSRKVSDSDNTEVVNMPKPTFHSNGKKTIHQRIHHVITPQHEEIIRYINATWQESACGESEPSSPTDTIGSVSSTSSLSGPTQILYYQDESPSPALSDFKPFDLETWWGKRLFQNITNSL